MKKPIYKDASKDIELRVNDLLKRMTVDEKLDQMVLTGMNCIDKLLKKVEDGEKVDISSTFVYGAFDVNDYNKLQKHQIENTRLGIPFILASENTHGVYNPLCTIFPTTGCMAATFDEKLIGKVGDASAKEAKILGISQVYAPNVDITWDYRWGRVEENFGEDTYLSSVMGAQLVKNFQKHKVAATVKHYIAYGLGESGLNLAPAHIGELEVREYMLPVFEACLKAGAWAIMPSYNEVDGMPVHASKKWMKDVLRDELKFDGMVVTDYGASNLFLHFHKIVENPLEAGIILCDNEVDFEADTPFGYGKDFRELVKSGKYPISKVNQCVKNILRLKFRTGLFDNPYGDASKVNTINNAKHKAIAKEVADKGIVMLKNDGILPLDRSKKVALIGPNSNICQLGDYIYTRYHSNTYTGRCVEADALSLKDVFEKEKIDMVFAKGSEFEWTSETMLKEAREAARQSDVAILVLGDNSNGGTCCGSQGDVSDTPRTKMAVTCGEGFDLHYIELTPIQKRLFDEVAKENKPIIMLMYGGRPHAITEQLDRCSGVFFAFGNGEQGNESMFDILYGKVNPSGKLPISIARSTGHLPCFYNYKPSARGANYKAPGTYDKPGYDYVFENPKPLFPFGYGLSYTKFEYSDLKIEQKSKTQFYVSFDITNVGEVDGDEVALLFLSAKKQSVTPMVRKLRKFTRVHLKVGETTTVKFLLNKEDFSYVNENYKKELAKTTFTVMVADKVGTLQIK